MIDFTTLSFNSINNPEAQEFLVQFQEQFYTGGPSCGWYRNREKDSQKVLCQCAGECIKSIFQQYQDAPDETSFTVRFDERTFSRVQIAQHLLPAIRILLHEYGVTSEPQLPILLRCTVEDRAKFSKILAPVEEKVEEKEERQRLLVGRPDKRSVDEVAKEREEDELNDQLDALGVRQSKRCRRMEIV